jgi:DNA (cytosine-5)-methyltransferase 1
MVTYRKLREKVIDSELKWKDIQEATGISNDVITKINKNDYITLRSLERFAEYFKCDIGDLVEIRR